MNFTFGKHIYSFLFFFLAFFYAKSQTCSFSLGNDTTICQGIPINFTLTATVGATSYLWDNGTALSTRQVSAFGTYYCKLTKNGTNVVANGNFGSGNNGFTSGYTLGTPGSSSWGLVGNPGTYAITTNASLVHSNFPSFVNHTTGGGNMMVVNGSSVANTSVWCQNILVSPNTNYNFSSWVVTCAAGNLSELAILQFSINGAVIGSPFSPSLTSGIWSQFNAQWNSGINTTASICIVNQNVNPSGNDFALDDIFFQPICLYTDTIKVLSKPFPVGFSAGADSAICSSTSAILTANNGTGNAFTWTSFPAGFTSSTLTAIVSPTDTTQYIFTSDLNGCKKSDTATVFVIETPNSSAGIDDTICAGKTITLNGNAGGGTLFGWTSIPAGFVSSQLNPTLTPLVSSHYILTSSNAFCIASDTVEIILKTAPKADFTVAPADSSCNSYTVSFSNNSTSSSSFLWQFGDGETSSDSAPQHIYNNQNIFEVKLIAKNSGCEDIKTSSLKISFSENALFIPNSFTPNNDLNNDTFQIPKGCLQTISVSIYDRWGSLIKQWETLNGFWDGKINGAPAQTGVYVYLLDGTFLNGEKAQKKGTITLFR